MTTKQCSVEGNKSLVDKVRAGTSPLLRNWREKLSYGYGLPNEEAKIRIQNDILDSLKESDGLPALVYPQDYIFDIAHLRSNGNLDEFIDDMSSVNNPEERFEMVKSENKILRERLHNALQREMKAIKTFQKLAHDNRLMHLKLKEYENANKARLMNSDPAKRTETNRSAILMGRRDFSPTYNAYNGDGNRLSPDKAKLTGTNLDKTKKTLTVDKGTSTADLKVQVFKDESTSTDALLEESCLIPKGFNTNGRDHDSFNTTSDVQKIRGGRNKSKSPGCNSLFKTTSSPSIMQGNYDLTDTVNVRTRSASVGSEDGNRMKLNQLTACKRSLSNDTISSSLNVITPLTKKLSEKRIISIASNLDVVNEESDFKDSKSSSFSSAEMTHSTSSDVESNSPCNTPDLQKEFRENALSPSNAPVHTHSKSLPAVLNQKRSQFQCANDVNDGNKFTSSRYPRRHTADFPRRKVVEHHVSTISLPAETTKMDKHTKIKENVKKRGSSSEDSDRNDSISSANLRRRRQAEDTTSFADDIRKFQKMLTSGQISQPSKESDDEEDILHAYEAARSNRYNARRGSAVVQMPASSVQMDLHVTTEEAIEDIKRSSRWTSILKNKKKLIAEKDRLRMSEDLKEYLQTISRPSHIASETELSLYKDTHWTHLMSVTDESGISRRLSQVENVSLPEAEMKRREAVWELFHSEVVYLTAHLLVLKECFLEPLRDIQNKGFLVTVDDKKIFTNLEDLCEVSAKFAKALLQMFKNEENDQFGSTASVVNAFTKFKWTVHPQYERYCLSYSKTLNYLEILKQNEHVQDFIRWCESDPRCNRLKLTDLLVAPFQHLTKYPLLLKNIGKRTSQTDNQHVPLTTTIKSVEDLIQELEGNITVIRNYQKLKDLQKNLTWPSVADLDPKSFIPEHLRNVVAHQECGDILASPKRELIYEGSLTLYEHTKIEITAFLFDDMLLLTLAKGAKKTNRLRKIGSVATIQEMHGLSSSPSISRKSADVIYTVWKQPVPIDRYILYDLDKYPGNSIKHGFVLVHISRFKQAIAIHTLQASSQDAKNIWLTKLREAQAKWNELIEEESQNECHNNISPMRDERKSDSDEYCEMNSDCDSLETSSDDKDGVTNELCIIGEESSYETYANEIIHANQKRDINDNLEHKVVHKKVKPSLRRKISRLT